MAENKTPAKASNDIVAQVAERIDNSSNVLIALSKDPSVDELSAAIGLSFILDELGKHPTAIFSGKIPNAIEFLEPEKTFEVNTNSLQDFIIALDKEKADHLRYKIDGDYVKVYITPYRTTIDESDLEFSHGDFNVDLVIALNVTSPANLDAALSQYGRIMHDASSINITAGVPGHFGNLEWGDPAASSISEMVFMLTNRLKGDQKGKLINKAVATALLAGIVSATNRFSNEHTTPTTMNVASQLMTAGADQQMISASIPTELVSSVIVDATEQVEQKQAMQDPSHLSVDHDSRKTVSKIHNRETSSKEQKALDDERSQKPETSAQTEDVSGIEASAQGELKVQSDNGDSVEEDAKPEINEIAQSEAENPEAELEKIIKQPDSELTSGPLMDELKEAANEKIIQPPKENEMAIPEQPKDYSAMISQALQEHDTTASNPAPMAPSIATSAEINGVPEINYDANSDAHQNLAAPTYPNRPQENSTPPENSPIPETTNQNSGTNNPNSTPEPSVAAAMANQPSTPEETIVPPLSSMMQSDAQSTSTLPQPATTAEVPANTNSPDSAPTSAKPAALTSSPTDFSLPMPDSNVLPPPPPPFDPNNVMGAVDFNPEAQAPSASPVPNSTTTTAENTTMPNVAPIEPATPEPEPEHSYLGSNPAMPDQLYPPQANDPGAFQIPNSNG